MVRLRDVMPKGYYARTVLIMFVPIVVLMIGMTWYYFNDHIIGVNKRLSEALGRDFELISTIHDRQPDLTPMNVSIISETQSFTLGIVPMCPFEDQRARVGREYPSVVSAMNSALDRPFRMSFTGENRDIAVCVPSNEEALMFIVPRKRAVVLNAHIFIVWVVGFGLLLIGLAWAFLRNQVRSILRLGELARAYGRGREVAGFKPSGATEVRELARAVIDMRDRIRAAADQRTAMLAAVSHDLRTPLTRLKLQLAMVDQDEDIRAARADLDDMAAMLDEYLAFARGEEGESAIPTRIDEIATILAASIDPDGQRITVRDLPEAEISVRPLAVKRALSNVLTNALDHADRVEIGIKNGPRAVEVLIDDDGPGIPPERHEEAFRPFARLDPSRNQNLAGVGLGLALARDVARSHGGDIRLEESPLGGLRVRFRLPY